MTWEQCFVLVGKSFYRVTERCSRGAPRPTARSCKIIARSPPGAPSSPAAIKPTAAQYYAKNMIITISQVTAKSSTMMNEIGYLIIN